MKNIKYMLLAAIFSFGFHIYAQQPGESKVPKDPKAKAILDQISKKNKGYSSIQSEFIYNLTNEANGINEDVKGVIVVKGAKYKVVLGEQEIRSDGKKVWTYLKDINEVQISCPENTASGITPSNVFTIWENGFKYQYEKLITEGGVQYDVIKMFPIEPKDKTFHTVKLYIDHNKKEVWKVEVYNKDGNRFTYTLKTFVPNVSAPDGMFRLDTSKIDEVVDLTDGGC